ncbi:MAG: homoserine O-acetyltransferase [Candidatus Sigynarchaeota archaeon]
MTAAFVSENAQNTGSRPAPAQEHEIIFPGTKFFHVPGSLQLDSGQSLDHAILAYETYGTLNARRDNCILICHALSGSSHVFQGSDTASPGGWWDPMGAPGACFDPARYFVVCVNLLGSCYGSSGPASINPSTGKPYGLSFPVVTVGDSVRAQHILIHHLGVDKILAVVGGSLGGMQALTWAIAYPDHVVSTIPIATSCQSSAQNIAFHEVGRQAIKADPNFNCGDYYGKAIPETGLAIARMIGHITYLSETSMRQKFGRKLQDASVLRFGFSTDFAVEGYLKHKGQAFTKRFDANAYLYLTKAVDYFDLTNGGTRTLSQAFSTVKSRFLVLSYSSDWLYPPQESKLLVQALKANHLPVSYCNIESGYGHDAFLLEAATQNEIIGNFLKALGTGGVAE